MLHGDSDTAPDITMKKAGSISLHLTLFALCASLPWALGQKPHQKIGSCPLPPSYPNCDVLLNKPMNQCATDQQCHGAEKCCFYGCSLQCKKPVGDKMGSCPDFNRTICLFARPAPAECINDSQCAGTERCCCHGNCRIECAETVRVNAGKCPPAPKKCKSPLPKPQCEVDSDCGVKQKCCSQCGKKCINPEPENPGFCPIDPELEQHCGYLPPPGCSRDADCGAGEKCCSFGCGVQCVKALPAKPGVCPVELRGCKFPLDKPQCQNDSDCQDRKKCCNHCGNKCVEPDQEHAGFCPAPSRRKCEGRYRSNCFQDSECATDEKCCNEGCRLACMKSLPEKDGVCAKIPTDASSDNICNKCNKDKDCPGIEKCCSGSKGLQCLQPVIVKSGACPVPRKSCALVLPQSPPKCMNDSQCPDKQKCCTPNCIPECTDPVEKEKSGTCPTVPDSVALCKRPRAAECQSDSNCKGKKKCCVYGCEVKCMDPLPDKSKPLRCFQSVECVVAPCPPLEEECAGPDDVCQLNQNYSMGCVSSAECKLRKAKDPSVTCCSSHLCNVSH